MGSGEDGRIGRERGGAERLKRGTRWMEREGRGIMVWDEG